MRRNLLILLELLLCSLSVSALNYRFRHITSEDGLPHQQVEALAQDADGNIWIGTRNGLARYDGYEIVSYYHEEGNEHSLFHNFINNLFVDKENRVWICTQNGLCRYRPATDDFRSYELPHGIISSMVQTDEGQIFCGGSSLCVYDEKCDSFLTYPSLGYGNIIAMAVDKHDRLYVSTNSAIFYYDDAMTKITNLPALCYGDFMTGTDDIIPMIFDRKGRLWVGRNGQGVMCVNLDDNTSRIYQPREISNGIVRVITEDSNGFIWLGTEKGVTCITPNGEIEVLHHRFDEPEQLSDNAIYAILQDRKQNLWIGSYFGGIDVLLNNNKQFLWSKPGYSAENIKGKVPRMMVETEPDVFWIATEDGGINIYDARQGHFSVFEGIPQLGTNVHSLYYDAEKREMWIGSYRQGLFCYEFSTGRYRRYLFSHGLSSNSVFSFARQKNGRFWVATTLGLYWYDEAADHFNTIGNPLLDRQFVYTLCVDHEDNLWAGMNLYGLFRIDGTTGEVRNWRASQGGSLLKDDYITCLYEGSDHRLWIGTNNNGLQSLDMSTGEIRSIEGDMILPKTTVCSIIESPAGQLWISTSQGLFQYSLANQAILRYTTESGLPTNQFNFSSSLLSREGLLLFGTVKGLVSFRPSQLTSNTGQLAVHLKRLVINNQLTTASWRNSPLKGELDKAETIVLSYDQARSFSIEYGVILPGSTTNVEYQVMLEGIDKSWRDVGAERKFMGYNLPDGSYLLHIRANDSSEGWDSCPEKTIKIIVRPPFYRSLWAKLFYVLMFLGIGYVAYRIVAVRIRERSILREATMEKQKMAEVDRAKFDFFTTVSHELKTPLSLIAAPLRSISREELSASSQKNLDMAIKNTQKMEGLINELVTFNKVETDSFPFYVQKGNPLTFIDLLVSAYQDIAAEKGLTLSSDFENNGEDVWFSPSYVERIVSNLLSNALKFTPRDGQVAVKARITSVDGSANTFLAVSVADTGIGIANEEQERIFNLYYQTKRGYNANNSGWGIGLSLVKRLAEVHKGRVWVDSEIGHGSTFHVLLDVSEQAFEQNSRTNEDKIIVPLSQYQFSKTLIESGASANGDTSSSSQQGRVSILIADDNPDLLSFLRNYFSSQYNVLTATNGRDALDLTRAEQVQMVVSDVMMPEMDGYELCRILKGDVLTSHIPVILLTAKTEQEDVVKGYECGAEAYVSKPFDPQILDLQMKNILQYQKARQSELVNTDMPDIDSTSLNELDKGFMHRINEVVSENLSNSDFAIADITQQLAISRSLLHTKMKNLTGISMGDYIRKKRLDKACQLLQQGFNVSETAYRTGFSDPNYFSKTFKKHIGISPTEYINEQNQ
ncbi:MAG: response regulator [Prevotella sp.]|nr:response regulator [Prevotella sp.]